jgi:RNA polymerase sigma-70 factor (family 1)
MAANPPHGVRMTSSLHESLLEPESSDRESQWVRRIRAGDKVAFAELFHAYYASLCLHVLGYVKVDAVAEEIVQDLLANLWVQRGVLRMHGGIRRYLFGAARNRAYNWVRDQRVVNRWEACAVEDNRVSGMSQGARPTDERVRDQEITRALEGAVLHLSERQREAFTLRRTGLSYTEIAQIMGISEKTVENTLSRAYTALRKELAPFF